jgi:hypothetical protein
MGRPAHINHPPTHTHTRRTDTAPTHAAAPALPAPPPPRSAAPRPPPLLGRRSRSAASSLGSPAHRAPSPTPWLVGHHGPSPAPRIAGLRGPSPVPQPPRALPSEHARSWPASSRAAGGRAPARCRSAKIPTAGEVPCPATAAPELPRGHHWRARASHHIGASIDIFLHILIPFILFYFLEFSCILEEFALI